MTFINRRLHSQVNNSSLYFPVNLRLCFLFQSRNAFSLCNRLIYEPSNISRQMKPRHVELDTTLAEHETKTFERDISNENHDTREMSSST